MKKIDGFVIKTYLPPFTATFFISIFVLLMQFFWTYMDDMVGKGLSFAVIFELLFYASASIIPMALPLAVLLSSIMTFGNLSERYELASMKSAGMSLIRVFRPLGVFIVFICIAAFLFSNFVLPVANLKFGSLLYDVTKSKPIIELQDGIFFNGIEHVSIRAQKKDTKTGELFKIIIYDHTERRGNVKVITAERGKISYSPDKRYLVLELFNGNSYEEPEPQQKRSYPFLRYAYNKQVIRFDISDFQLNRTDEELFKDNYQMLRLDQLVEGIEKLDSAQEYRTAQLKKIYQLNLNFLEESADTVIYDFSPFQLKKRYTNVKEKKTLNSFEKLSKSEQLYFYEMAIQAVRGLKIQIESIDDDMKLRSKMIARHEVEWHRKFTLAFSCFLLFLIGAPLGAIIRKGGLGMPVVVAIVIYVIFHIVTITGEKMAKEASTYVVVGMWLPIFMFIPLGLILIKQATADSAVFDSGFYKNLFSLEKMKQLPFIRKYFNKSA